MVLWCHWIVEAASRDASSPAAKWLLSSRLIVASDSLMIYVNTKRQQKCSGAICWGKTGIILAARGTRHGVGLVWHVSPYISSGAETRGGWPAVPAVSCSPDWARGEKLEATADKKLCNNVCEKLFLNRNIIFVLSNWSILAKMNCNCRHEDGKEGF